MQVITTVVIIQRNKLQAVVLITVKHFVHSGINGPVKNIWFHIPGLTLLQGNKATI